MSEISDDVSVLLLYNHRNLVVLRNICTIEVNATQIPAEVAESLLNYSTFMSCHEERVLNEVNQYDKVVQTRNH